MEQKEATKRVADAARSEITRYYNEQKVVESTAGQQLRDDLKRREREIKTRQGEADTLESLYQNERVKHLSAVRADEEERLAGVLGRRAQAQERQGREMQQLREQSEELRGLAEALRVARMNKGRVDQLAERNVLRTQAAEYDAAFDASLAAGEAAAATKEAEHNARRKEQNIAARMVLEEQMQEKQEAIKLAEVEFQRERGMVDEVLRRIAQEDCAEVALRRSKQEETKAFIAAFLKEQDEKKRAALESSAKEDRRIAEYWQMVKEREQVEAGRQAARKEVADRMYEKMKREMEGRQALREEEEELINLLQQEELEAKRRAEDEARAARAEAMKREMVRANEYQMRLKAERESAQHEEEEFFKRSMLAKFAEDDRLEQMNAAKRRMKAAEHQRAVQAMIEERRRLFEEQKGRDEAEVETRRREEARRADLIESERMALLREVDPTLLQYLPKGVVRHQADLDYINGLMAAHRLNS
ncbi:MAG: hypothetical protein WDW38_001158 [Sanguina aurantia]